MATTAERPPGRDAPARPTREQRREIARVMSEVTDDVRELPERHLKAFRPVLEDARKEVAEDLKEWLRRAPGANERFTAQHLRSVLAQIDRARKSVGERLSEEMEGELRRGGERAGERALSHLEEQVARFSAVFGDSVRPLEVDKAAVMASGQRTLIPRFETSAARYGEDITRDIRRQLAVGVARNETFEQMTNRLVHLGGPRGEVALQGILGEPGALSEHISEGLFRRYRHWAERIVRTECLEAYNEVHHQALVEADREDPGYMARWDATDDRRACDRCAELDGKIVALDGEFDRRRTGRRDDIDHVVRHPPLHPNDRCALTPWRREWGEEDEEGKDRDPRAPVTEDDDVEAERGLRRMAEGDMQRARGSLEKSLSARGLVRRDYKTQAIEPTADLGGADGVHHTQGAKAGRIELMFDVMDDARQAASQIAEGNDAAVYGDRRGPWRGLSTVVHEVLHGYGPPDRYGSGVVTFIEEVTTEVSAGAMMQRSYRMPRKNAVDYPAYAGWVKGLRAEVESVFGVDADKAHGILEEASDSFKREQRDAPPSESEAVDLFARKFPDHHREMRDAVLKVSELRP